MELRYKIFMLDPPSKMIHWLSDFLVGRVIQVNMNGFLSDKISPIAGVPQGSVLSPLLFLIYVNDVPKLTTDKTQNPSLLMTLLYGLLVKMYKLQQNFLKRTYQNWQSGVPNGEKNSILKNKSHHILQVLSRQKTRTHSKTVWRET